MGPVADACGAILEMQMIWFGGVEAEGRSTAAAQEVWSAGTLPMYEVTIRTVEWTGACGGIVLPAGATHVRTGGARAA